MFFVLIHGILFSYSRVPCMSCLRIDSIVSCHKAYTLELVSLICIPLPPIQFQTQGSANRITPVERPLNSHFWTDMSPQRLLHSSAWLSYLGSQRYTYGLRPSKFPSVSWSSSTTFIAFLSFSQSSLCLNSRSIA